MSDSQQTNRERAVHLTIYDLQGGPINPKVLPDVEKFVDGLLDWLDDPSIAVNIVVE